MLYRVCVCVCVCVCVFEISEDADSCDVHWLCLLNTNFSLDGTLSLLYLAISVCHIPLLPRWTYERPAE